MEGLPIPLFQTACAWCWDFFDYIQAYAVHFGGIRKGLHDGQRSAGLFVDAAPV